METAMKFEYTNECTCEVYDPETDTSTPTSDCYGDCWEFTVEDFTNITEHLFVDNAQGFSITGFPVWNGTVDGRFTARTAKDLLHSMTPDGTSWRLDGTVYADRIEAVLYHHDAPMGGKMVVAPIGEDSE
jgi:hypothetical protein